jgi:hypothetical protein
VSYHQHIFEMNTSYCILTRGFEKDLLESFVGHVLLTPLLVLQVNIGLKQLSHAVELCATDKHR